VLSPIERQSGCLPDHRIVIRSGGARQRIKRFYGNRLEAPHSLGGILPLEGLRASELPKQQLQLVVAICVGRAGVAPLWLVLGSARSISGLGMPWTVSPLLDIALWREGLAAVAAFNRLGHNPSSAGRALPPRIRW
jgi:hypothetical protein